MSPVDAPSPPTQTEDRILGALLVCDREVDNNELKKLVNATLTGSGNQKLIALGYVTTDRSRPLRHALTAVGRQYAETLSRPEIEAPKDQERWKLSPNQILALVVLMAEARELTNKELGELAGFPLTGADNKALEKLGLVVTDRTKRPYAHQLTDEGWFVAHRLHTTAVPEEGRSAIRSLFTLLANLSRSVDRLGISYGEFFKQSGVVATSDVEGAARAAYQQLADRPGNWVGLADLRERLGGLARSKVDETLRAMVRQPGVRIIPVANSKSLSSRDREAALRIGDEDNHTISIGAS